MVSFIAHTFGASQESSPRTSTVLSLYLIWSESFHLHASVVSDREKFDPNLRGGPHLGAHARTARANSKAKRSFMEESGDKAQRK